MIPTRVNSRLFSERFVSKRFNGHVEALKWPQKTIGQNITFFCKLTIILVSMRSSIKLVQYKAFLKYICSILVKSK